MSLDHRQQAWNLLQQAYQAQMEGELDRAVELYKSSLEICPTAEAHTFLGWTYHFQGKVDAAIAECKLAIEVDPDFGNPYNDIGSYLIALGRNDEAIPWLARHRSAALRTPPLPSLQSRPSVSCQGRNQSRAEKFSGIAAHRAGVRARASGDRKSSPHAELGSARSRSGLHNLVVQPEQNRRKDSDPRHNPPHLLRAVQHFAEIVQQAPT